MERKPTAVDRAAVTIQPFIVAFDGRRTPQDDDHRRSLPLSARDTRGTLIFGLVGEVHAEGHTIMVTHEADVAAHAARVVVLRDGQVHSDRPQTPHAARAGAIASARV